MPCSGLVTADTTGVRLCLDRDPDFFANGGDSLAAVEIVTRVGELVGREVSVAALLDAPTPTTPR